MANFWQVQSDLEIQNGGCQTGVIIFIFIFIYG